MKHHHPNVNGNDDHETGMISFVFTYMKAWPTPVELIVAVFEQSEHRYNHKDGHVHNHNDRDY